MAEKPRIQLFTPASRIVSGNVQKPNLTDMHGKPRSSPQYFFAVAFPKTHPDCGAMFRAMHDFAAAQYAYYPHVVQRINALWTVGPKCGFAFKFEDGDIPHPQKGIRPGYAGCWVMKFTSTFPIRCCNEHGQDIDPAQVLTGYLVDVAFNITINEKTDHTAGIYLNPVFVRLLSHAQVIVGGPQAGQVFAGRSAPKHELGNFAAAMQPQAGQPGAGGTSPGQVIQQATQAIQGSFQRQEPAPQYQQGGPANPGFHQAAQGYPGGAPQGNGGHSPHEGVSTGGNFQAPGGAVAGNPPQPHSMPSLPGSPGGMHHQVHQNGSAPIAPEMSGSGGPNQGHAIASPSSAPSGAPEGNGHVNAPAVPGGASLAPAHSTGAPQGSPIASPSETAQTYAPHPGFVHGGQAA